VNAAGRKARNHKEWQRTEFAKIQFLLFAWCPMSALVSFLTAAAKAAWPMLEPVLMQVARNLVTDLLTAAKSQTLPAKFAFLAGPLATVESDLLKLVTPATATEALKS